MPSLVFLAASRALARFMTLRRVCAGIAGIAAVGCGGTVLIAPSGDADAGKCVPATCAQFGAECGDITDGCGGTLQCGLCVGGGLCGASAPNRCANGASCGAGACASRGAACGVITDPCNAAVDCGTCANGANCVANRCPCEGPGCGGPADAGIVDTGVPDGAVAGSPTVTSVALATAALVADPKRHLLYVTVPATAGAMGNSVATIDPTTASVTASILVGSDPNALALTDDGSTLHVGIDGASSVTSLVLATGTVGALVPLGPGTNGEGPCTAGEIHAVPGSTTRYLVSRVVRDLSPDFAGLALFDGTTPLGTWTGFVGGEAVAFVNASTFYGLNNEDSSLDLYSFTISPGGTITQGADFAGEISGFDEQLVAQGGWIFGNSGQTVSAATGAPVGAYTPPVATPGDDVTFMSVVPDPNGTDVWFLDAPELAGIGGNVTIDDYDRATFLLRASYPVPEVDTTTGDPSTGPEATSLVQWSPTGFAFRTADAVYIVTFPPTH
jgi:hypothetical protein